MSAAKNSVSSISHTNKRLRGTHWVRSPELSEPPKTHWVRCLKPYSPKPYSARFRGCQTHGGLVEGIAAVLGSENGSCYRGVSQLQSHQSRYSVQLAKMPTHPNVGSLTRDTFEWLLLSFVKSRCPSQMFCHFHCWQGGRSLIAVPTMEDQFLYSGGTDSLENCTAEISASAPVVYKNPPPMAQKFYAPLVLGRGWKCPWRFSLQRWWCIKSCLRNNKDRMSHFPVGQERHPDVASQRLPQDNSSLNCHPLSLTLEQVWDLRSWKPARTPRTPEKFKVSNPKSNSQSDCLTRKRIHFWVTCRFKKSLLGVTFKSLWGRPRKSLFTLHELLWIFRGSGGS